MENLFHGRNVLPHLTFDLKGKTRKAKQDTEDTVLLDTDLFTHTRYGDACLPTSLAPDALFAEDTRCR